MTSCWGLSKDTKFDNIDVVLPIRLVAVKSANPIHDWFVGPNLVL